MSHAAELLTSAAAPPDAVEAALEDVVREGLISEFTKAFGPRRLMKALACGRLTDRAAELADTILSADGASSGLSPALGFTEILHREELCPDDKIDLSSEPPPLPADANASGRLLQLRLENGKAAFVPDACQVLHDADTSAADASAPKESPTLVMVSPPRRERIGSEIETKVWSAAVMLGRWLWHHHHLVHGRSVLELGCGTGTAGLAAAKCGARRVVGHRPRLLPAACPPTMGAVWRSSAPNAPPATPFFIRCSPPRAFVGRLAGAHRHQ